MDENFFPISSGAYEQVAQYSTHLFLSHSTHCAVEVELQQQRLQMWKERRLWYSLPWEEGWWRLPGRSP